MSGPWKSLLVPPPATASTPPPPSWDMTADEAVKVAAIDDHFNDPDLKPPLETDGEELAALSEREMMFLSKETFIR
jgi:hypothetical protein